jgi:hypothetical protein
LTISWPDDQAASRSLGHDERAGVLTTLEGVFEQMIVTTRVVSSRSRVEDDQFSGWLAYSNFDRAYKTVSTLHESLKSHGLGMRQWSRDLFIPRSRS